MFCSYIVWKCFKLDILNALKMSILFKYCFFNFKKLQPWHILWKISWLIDSSKADKKSTNKQVHWIIWHILTSIFYVFNICYFFDKCTFNIQCNSNLKAFFLHFTFTPKITCNYFTASLSCLIIKITTYFFRPKCIYRKL